MAKEFEGIDLGKQETGTQKVYELTERGRTSYRVQSVPSEQETQERLDTMRTQGRKGIKATRINMAFSPKNAEYIRTMAAMRGQHMTEFVNQIITEHRQRNIESYLDAQLIIKQVKEREAEEDGQQED